MLVWLAGISIAGHGEPTDNSEYVCTQRGDKHLTFTYPSISSHEQARSKKVFTHQTDYYIDQYIDYYIDYYIDHYIDHYINSKYIDF